ncbi:protein CCA1-like isoform X2 [Typha angustifolia]|uniref:protein CCA1-like isoform X2 n=1 Tax=Typha angustifolia TaxID=59011 RepID=UPI003C2D2554
MDVSSSSEDLTSLKKRKPYTITKQREKWTEEEHSRFLKALKLYGRAWQRIQEHIGTKSAVQIRSHAQKFFSKLQLEKEALAKGTPVGQSLDIEIPPPRPKRKPNCPYPRNTVMVGSSSPGEEAIDGKVTNSIASPGGSKLVFNHDGDASHELLAIEKQRRAKQTSEEGSSSEVFNLLPVAPCSSISSANKGSSNVHTFKHYLSLTKEGEKISPSESSQTVKRRQEQEQEQNNAHADVDDLRHRGVCINWEEKLAFQKKMDVVEQHEKCSPLFHDNLQNTQCYSNHVQVQNDKSKQIIFSGDYVLTQTTDQFNTNPKTDHFLNSTTTAKDDCCTDNTMSSIYQPCPALSPVTESSNSSSLIISTLLQNPPIHAVASLAASIWPSGNANVSMSTTPDITDGVGQNAQMNSRSMSAIAAATVAAASAWWAANGLLPLSHPPQPTYVFPPLQTMPLSTMKTTQAQENKEKEDVGILNLLQPNVNPVNSGDLRTGPTDSKSMLSSESEDYRRKGETSQSAVLKCSMDDKPKAEFHDSNKARGRKTSVRSSKGSKSPSSSVIDTKKVMKKQKEVNSEAEQIHFANYWHGEASNFQLSSSGGIIKESRKEFSGEGHSTPLALFTGENLPKSLNNKDGLWKKEDSTASIVDLNGETSKSSNEATVYRKQVSLVGKNQHVKLKASRRAFKPYKRCSVEAENQTTINADNTDKRFPLEE